MFIRRLGAPSAMLHVTHDTCTLYRTTRFPRAHDSSATTATQFTGILLVFAMGRKDTLQSLSQSWKTAACTIRSTTAVATAYTTSIYHFMATLVRTVMKMVSGNTTMVGTICCIHYSQAAPLCAAAILLLSYCSCCIPLSPLCVPLR